MLGLSICRQVLDYSWGQTWLDVWCCGLVWCPEEEGMSEGRCVSLKCEIQSVWIFGYLRWFAGGGRWMCSRWRLWVVLFCFLYYLVVHLEYCGDYKWHNLVVSYLSASSCRHERPGVRCGWLRYIYFGIQYISSSNLHISGNLRYHCVPVGILWAEGPRKGFSVEWARKFPVENNGLRCMV